MKNSQNEVEQLLDDFESYTHNITSFLSNQPELFDPLTNILKRSYDTSKSIEKNRKSGETVAKLLVKNFDVDQIWEQIQLQNKYISNELTEKIQRYITNRSSVTDEKNIENTNDNINLADSKIKKKVTFKLDESVSSDPSDGESDANEPSERVLESQSDLSDLDDDINSDTSDSELLRRDPVTENNDENDIKSSFEERQRRLQQHVEKLESEAVSEKPWQLIGEVTAKKRPQNSLLEEVVEFDLSARPAPIITEEAAQKLEDVILNRIQNRVWDDVERKIKPVENQSEFKKPQPLPQQKSELSLAQIYEQEYLNQRKALDPENNTEKKEEPKEHKQLKSLLSSLFYKLDALSNYHYTPLPSVPEMQIVTNMPAVAMEEAVPTATSDATLLAPEEIRAKKKGELISKDERNETDKKRALRLKKRKQRSKKKQIEAREKLLEKSKKSSKFSKDRIEKEVEKLMKNKAISHFKQNPNNEKDFKSSTAVFKKLQDTTSKTQNLNKVKRKLKSNVKLDPKKVKL